MRTAVASYELRRDVLLIVLIALLPALLFWYTSPWGIGISVDSIRYFQMADVFASDRPPGELGTHFPPGYPWLLGQFVLDSYLISFSARVLQTLLVFLLGCSVLGLIYQTGSRSLVPCLVVGAALTLRVDVYNVLYFAWSETLYGVLLIATIWLFLAGLDKRSRTLLLVAGVMGGVSILVRYAGISFAGLLVLAVLLFNPGRQMAERFVQGLVLAFGIAVPLFIWKIMAAAAGLNRVPREMVFHLPSFDKLSEGITTVGHWFNQGFGWIAGIVFTLGLVGVLWLAWPRATTAERNRILILGFLVLGYFGFLLATLLLFDAYVSLLPRILFPALVVLVVLLGLLLSQVWKRGALTQKAFGAAVVGFFAAGSAGATYDMTRIRTAEGDGFGSKYYRSFAFWQAVDEIGDDHIVTNFPELLFLHAAIPANMLPRKYNAVTDVQNPDFAEEMGKLSDAVKDGETTIVYFRSMIWRKYLPTVRETMALAEGKPTYVDDEVFVYRLR